MFIWPRNKVYKHSQLPIFKPHAQTRGQSHRFEVRVGLIGHVSNMRKKYFNHQVKSISKFEILAFW